MTKGKSAKSVACRTLASIFEMGVIDHHGVAIDAGAGEGDWTGPLADMFDFVHVFEPSDHKFPILMQRFRSRANVWLHKNSLAKYASQHNGRMQIDEFELKELDFLRLEIGGAEYYAAQGGIKTIKRCRPVILVATDERAKLHNRTPQCVIKLLEFYGYAISELSPQRSLCTPIAQQSAR